MIRKAFYFAAGLAGGFAACLAAAALLSGEDPYLYADDPRR